MKPILCLVRSGRSLGGVCRDGMRSVLWCCLNVIGCCFAGGLSKCRAPCASSGFVRRFASCCSRALSLCASRCVAHVRPRRRRPFASLISGWLTACLVASGGAPLLHALHIQPISEARAADPTKSAAPTSPQAPSSPFTTIIPAHSDPNDTRPDIVKRGEYLARAGDCIACHTAPRGKLFAGGLAMETPFGTLYSPNITPDAQYGIGTWSEEAFFKMMRTGRKPDGALIYPAMPIAQYTKVTREDSNAIFAFLRTVDPVREPNRKHTLRFPFNQRELLYGWRTLYFHQGEFKPTRPDRSNGIAARIWSKGSVTARCAIPGSTCLAARRRATSLPAA